MTSTPDNWYFRDGGDGGAPAGGPLVILDLDGIISDATHRQHYLRGAFKDFRGFFTAAPTTRRTSPAWPWPPPSPTTTRWPSSPPARTTWPTTPAAGWPPTKSATTC